MTRPHVVLSVAAAVAFSALAACSSCGAPAPFCDTCVDSGPDRRRDSSDGSSNDALDVDAAPTAFLEGWKPIAWANCDVYEPATQAAWDSVSKPVWGPCVVPPTFGTCSELQINWSASPQLGYINVRVQQIGSKLRVSANRAVGTAAATEWLVAEDDAVVAAWRSETLSKCFAYLPERGDSLSQLVATVRDPPLGFSPYVTVIGNPTSLNGRASPDDQFVAQDLGVNEGILVGRMWGSGPLGLYEFTQGARIGIRNHTKHSVGLTNTKAIDTFVVQDDAAFFTGVESDHLTVRVWTEADGSQLLVDRGSNVDAHDFATDGTTMTWIESTGLSNGTYAQSTLYRAPYTRKSNLVVPTKVLDGVCPFPTCMSRMSEGYLMTFFGGTLAVDPDYLLLRLSDNAKWKLPFVKNRRWDPGWVIGDTLYVAPAQKTLQRYPLSSLGPPNL